MSKTQEAIDTYLEKLKDPQLTHDKFVEYTQRVKMLRSLDETE
jgi:hypothetical protein